jgi:hypothetical protein
MRNGSWSLGFVLEIPGMHGVFISILAFAWMAQRCSTRGFGKHIIINSQYIRNKYVYTSTYLDFPDLVL